MRRGMDGLVKALAHHSELVVLGVLVVATVWVAATPNLDVPQSLDAAIGVRCSPRGSLPQAYRGQLSLGALPGQGHTVAGGSPRERPCGLWQPTVRRRDDGAVVVVFFTFTALWHEVVLRHRDTFEPGVFTFQSESRAVAHGGGPGRSPAGRAGRARLRRPTAGGRRDPSLSLVHPVDRARARPGIGLRCRVARVRGRCR